MEFTIIKDGIRVDKMNYQDEAFVRDTLKLRKNGDWCKLVRKDEVVGGELPNQVLPNSASESNIVLETKSRK